MRFITLAALALFAIGCTYNDIQFESDSIRPFEAAVFEPGQGGDDAGGADSETAGGQDRSPAGSNALRGYGQFGIVIVQGGETTPDVSANPAANVNSPGSEAGSGDGADQPDGE